MSPSLTEQIIVTLAPERAQVLRFGRGWRPPLLASAGAELTRAHYEAPEGLVGVLQPILNACNPRSRPVKVLLSDQFFHFAVLPGDRSVARAQDQRALARIVFERQFGAQSQGWELQWSPEGVGEPMLACGIDKTLLATIRQALAAPIRIRALRPVLMGIVSHHRDVLERKTACLAIFEHARMTLVWLYKGRWQLVMGRSVDLADRGAPGRIFTEQMALQHTGGAGTVWQCVLAGKAPGTLHPEWKTQSLPRPEIDHAVHDGLAIWGLR